MRISHPFEAPKKNIRMKSGIEIEEKDLHFGTNYKSSILHLVFLMHLRWYSMRVEIISRYTHEIMSILLNWHSFNGAFGKSQLTVLHHDLNVTI